ncbi:MAG: hypothetical protein K6T83_07860 [Alicyclobacillus sp.]|nr:hypothetical protein [Alicyclobacillus sp.]
MREVVALLFEFVLSLVIIVGGGFLLYTGHATDIAIAAIMTVIPFWFTRRSQEQQQSNQQSLLDQVTKAIQDTATKSGTAPQTGSSSGKTDAEQLFADPTTPVPPGGGQQSGKT